MPIGPYKDFDDCVAQNQDIENPEAYCGWLENQLKEEAGLVSSESVKLQIVRAETTFADLNGDGLDDITGEPVETEVEIEIETEMEMPEAPALPVSDRPEEFHTLLVVEGVWTGDGRYIEEDALTWRPLPLPLMGLDKTTDAHDEARLIGNITRIDRQGRELHGYGNFVVTDDEEVLRLQALIKSGDLRGVSVDLDAMEYELVMPADMVMEEPVVEEEMPVDGEQPIEGDQPVEDVQEEPAPEMDEYKIRVTAATLMGATVVPFPAFQEAYIESVAVLTAALNTTKKVSGWITEFQTFQDIDFSPPKGARLEAEKGLEWRNEYGRGGTAVGVARARDIANGRSLSPETVTRMVSYFARHEVDKQGEGWSPGEPGFPSAGRIAWALWGGDPGRVWAEKVKNQMDVRQRDGSVVASVHPVNAPVCPPAEWFADPKLSGPTPMTVTDDGRLFGHVATWGSCHIGFHDQCVTPPRSLAQYQHYLTGEIVCEDGSRLAVGQITMDTGHAPLNASGPRALAHYDNTGTAVADVRTGEDKFGIWMAGALRPNLDPVKIRGLMASDVSGDWRRIGGNLELVGVLAVNVPGFPKARVQVHENEGLIASLIASLPADPQDVKAVKQDDRVKDRIAASIGRSKKDRLSAVKKRIHGE